MLTAAAVLSIVASVLTIIRLITEWRRDDRRLEKQFSGGFRTVLVTVSVGDRAHGFPRA